MGTKRDDFTEPTKENMRKRVAFLCSNPDCKKITVGPHTDPEKATLVGVAAHITAAAPLGTRYDATMTPIQRRHINNGIWLCTSCSMLIDKDPDKYPVSLLHEWKTNAEKEAADNLAGKKSTEKETTRPFLEADLIYTSSMRINRGLSKKNDELFLDKVILAGSPVVIHWDIKWDLSLVIYNNSLSPAFNVSVEADATLLGIPQLRKVNNLPALAHIDLNASYQVHLESSFIEADTLMANTIPPAILNKEFLIKYFDENRKEHSTLVVIADDGLINVEG